MKIKYSLAALLVISSLNATDNLGTISVESSTIDDKFKTTQTDVSNVTLIDNKEIQKVNPQNIVEVLNSIPGITAMQTEGDIVKIHIRGIGNQVYMGEKPGVAVVIDGVPVQETTGKINVDLDNIASIKVIKGGASYLYGNDAIAGAIVITTKRTKGESQSKIETEAGSFGYKRFLASTNQSFENYAIQLQGSFRDSDGYWDRAFYTNKSLNGKYSYYLDDTSDIVVGLDYTKIKSGDGSGVHGVDAASVDPKSSREITYASDYDTTLLKAFVTYSKDLDDDSNLMFNTYRFTDKKTYQSAYEDVDGDGFNEAHDYANDEKWAQNGLKSEYRTTINSTAIMAGIDIQRNKDKSIAEVLPWGTGSYGPLSDSSIDTDENIDALYLELKQQLSTKLTGTFNIRYDDIEYKLNDNYDSTNNVNPSYDETSYRAGVNYTLNENNSLYTSISTGFRAPTAGQISSNSEGGYTTDIDSEKTYNYEIGIKGLISNFNYEASIYQLDRKDYIGTTSGNYVRSSDEDIYYDNVANMRSRGLELSLNSDKKKDLSFNLAYTYLDAQYTKYNYKQLVVDNGFPTPDVFQTLDLSGNQVPRTSKHTLNLIVDFKTTSALTISPEVIAKSSYYADDTNQFKQSGYALVNLRANYKIDKSLEFFAKIDNLLDKDYYQFVNVTASTVDKNMDDSTIIVGPTRSFYAGLRYKF